MAEEKKVTVRVVKRHPRDYSEVLRDLKPGRNPLGQFIPWPKHLVEIQEEDEQILLLVRRHWLTNVKWILIVFLMLVAGVFLLKLPFFLLMPASFKMVTEVLWYLICLAVVLEGFLGWYFDVLIVTDERIIDIDFRDLIYKNITSAKIDKIEDVTYSVSGAVHSLFNFGSVLVQTAGAGLKMVPDQTHGTLEFWDTPNPAMVAKLINELMIEEEREQIEGRVS